MSKIQEALKRLQSEGPAPAAPVRSRGSESTRVASIRATDSESTAELPSYTQEEIVVVDQAALRDAGLIAPEYHEQMLADQYREIKRPLVANAYGRRVAKIEDGNLIMVTSAVAGEGKTFTSINLALSISQEQDLSVLLVDADVAKPHISDIFGLSDRSGLLDLLEDDSLSPESLIMPTDMEGFAILPAGSPRSNATELLSGLRMDSVIEQLGKRYGRRVIIFDTPPLLQTSESKVLANMAGQIVLVVKAESTSQGAVADALHIVGDDKAINLVLNQSRVAGQNNQYEYGYGFNEPAPTAQTSSSSMWDS